jgi:hypothetical protein
MTNKTYNMLFLRTVISAHAIVGKAGLKVMRYAPGGA